MFNKIKELKLEAREKELELEYAQKKRELANKAVFNDVVLERTKTIEAINTAIAKLNVEIDDKEKRIKNMQVEWNARGEERDVIVRVLEETIKRQQETIEKLIENLHCDLGSEE